MAQALISNNATTTISVAVSTTGQTTLTVVSATNFPSSIGTDYFYVTLLDSANIPEIVKITAVAGLNFTMVRAQDGTAARTFLIGATVRLAITKAVMDEYARDALVVHKSGDTYTGAHVMTAATVTVPTATPLTNSLVVASTAYVEAAVAVETARAAPKANPTLTGTVTVPTPVNPTDAANKAYADALAFSTVVLPAQAGNAGKYVTTDGSNASWATVVGVYSYTSRASLRALSPTADALYVVEGLGLFRWVSASTEMDDDETAFATASGVWELVSTDPEFVNVMAEGAADEVRSETVVALAAAAAKFKRGTFSMSLTSLATLTSSAFTATVTGAAVGDSVFVTPGDDFGTTAADKGALSFVARVSATDTVTISIRNASAATANMTASTWAVLVIKQ
jgi:hypothetical protein